MEAVDKPSWCRRTIVSSISAFSIPTHSGFVFRNGRVDPLFPLRCAWIRAIGFLGRGCAYRGIVFKIEPVTRRQRYGFRTTRTPWSAWNGSTLRKSITSVPASASVRFVDSKILAGDAETSADRAFIIRKPVPPDRTSSKFRRKIASWSRWATSWYTTSTEPIRPAYDSGFAASPRIGTRFGRFSASPRRSRNDRGEISTAVTIPSAQMSETWLAVVPLPAPRQRPDERRPNGHTQR